MPDQEPSTLANFRDRANSSSVSRSDFAGSVAMSKAGTDLNDTVNFRVNSGLKAEFDKLCRENHTSISRELKRFMTEAIRTQRIL